MKSNFTRYGNLHAKFLHVSLVVSPIYRFAEKLGCYEIIHSSQLSPLWVPEKFEKPNRKTYSFFNENMG